MVCSASKKRYYIFLVPPGNASSKMDGRTQSSVYWYEDMIRYG